jgi:hypothetical protein
MTPTADAIKQLLIPADRPELKTFRLVGREHLASVTVATPDLRVYGQLRFDRELTAEREASHG